jgi:hypothetical protein
MMRTRSKGPSTPIEDGTDEIDDVGDHAVLHVSGKSRSKTSRPMPKTTKNPKKKKKRKKTRHNLDLAPSSSDEEDGVSAIDEEDGARIGTADSGGNVRDALKKVGDGSYTSWMQAHAAFKAIKKRLPMSGRDLEDLFLSNGGVIMRKDPTTKNPISKKWLCKKLDEILDSHVAVQSGLESLTPSLKSNFNKARDGYRFVCAIFHSKTQLKNAYRSHSRSGLDDPKGSSHMTEFVESVVRVFNAADLASFPITTRDDPHDDVNERIIRALPLTKSIELTFAKAKTWFTKLNKEYRRVEGNMDKSGHNNNDPRA